MSLLPQDTKEKSPQCHPMPEDDKFPDVTLVSKDGKIVRCYPCARGRENRAMLPLYQRMEKSAEVTLVSKDGGKNLLRFISLPNSFAWQS